MAIALFSAHYHEGQGCRIYRMGCRAGKLFEARTSAGAFVFSRQGSKALLVSRQHSHLIPALTKCLDQCRSCARPYAGDQAHAFWSR